MRLHAEGPTTAAKGAQCYFGAPSGPSFPVAPRRRVISNAATQFQSRHYECEACTAPSTRSSSPAPSASSTEFPGELYDAPFLDTPPAPASEPPITYANIDKARKLLKYNPTTDVHRGLERMWQWYQQTYL